MKPTSAYEHRRKYNLYLSINIGLNAAYIDHGCKYHKKIDFTIKYPFQSH